MQALGIGLVRISETEEEWCNKSLRIITSGFRYL